MGTADTKEKLIQDALRLITSIPQISSVGYSESKFTSSASISYDYILETEMESFIFGFGIRVLELENPQNEKSSSGNVFLEYSIPEDVGKPVCVIDSSQIPEIKLLVGNVGLNNIPSYWFKKLPESKLQVLSQTSEKISLIYISRNPDVANMSSVFKNALRYELASEIALKLSPAGHHSRMWHIRARSYFIKARKYALDDSRTYVYEKASYTDRALSADEKGRNSAQTLGSRYYREFTGRGS